ncbi:phosphatidylethanolamine-binding protein, putative [Plasmodium vinckei]|uniref:Phosphatidylethanolamine-binding protein, putative n=1 Tax=Plasmodium vinckei TaxID=5860 RepID=A0A6V7SGW8_PLAVN|nr:phosphatidylethanolamine-binding protein, putative [Plasmodium vinckei]
MDFLGFAFLLCYLFSVTFVFAKIDVIQSGGAEKVEKAEKQNMCKH